MRITDVFAFIPYMLAASRAFYQQRSNIGAGPVSGVPPTDYTLLNQSQLLASFSDAIGPDGITPRSMRNFVASTITTGSSTSPSSTPLPLPGWTTSTRPTGMVGPVFGFNYTTGQMEIWNDQTQTWGSPVFTGGHVPNLVICDNGLDTSNLSIQNAATGIVFSGLSKTFPSGAASGTLWSNGNTVSLVP